MHRSRALDRQLDGTLRRLERRVGADLERLRIEADATKAAVAAKAGIDRTFYGRIEAGEASASIETLAAIGLALGADLSIRYFAGAGPRLVDRHQALMVEALLAALGPMWRAHLEVPVWRPVRGVIDAVLERRSGAGLVVAECQSSITRLEQIVRWSHDKAAAIGSSTLVPAGGDPTVRRLLVVRSTATNREIARQFDRLLTAAYPGRTASAVAALRDGAPFEEDAVVWIRIERGRAELLDAPPRGVNLGR